LKVGQALLLVNDVGLVVFDLRRRDKIGALQILVTSKHFLSDGKTAPLKLDLLVDTILLGQKVLRTFPRRLQPFFILKTLLALIQGKAAAACLDEVRDRKRRVASGRGGAITGQYEENVPCVNELSVLYLALRDDARLHGHDANEPFGGRDDAGHRLLAGHRRAKQEGNDGGGDDTEQQGQSSGADTLREKNLAGASGSMGLKGFFSEHR
jgi:hypothetical protein